MTAIEKIKHIVRNDSGDTRTLSRKAVDKIADLTWAGDVTYGDLESIGGTTFRDKVWRQENIFAKAWMQKEFKRHGELDLSWRKGVEMAYPSKAKP